MTKSDLRARPVLHHQRDAIEAHLTVVFAALAVARHLQDTTGVTIKKLVRTLRAARSATIEFNGQRLTFDPYLSDAARAMLARLQTGHSADGTSQAWLPAVRDGWRGVCHRRPTRGVLTPAEAEDAHNAATTALHLEP